MLCNHREYVKITDSEKFSKKCFLLITASCLALPRVTVQYIHVATELPYSGKFSLGANFRDFRGQTCFRENKNRKKMH